MQDHPPVAEFVAEPLDDQRAIGGQVSGRLALLGDECREVAAGVLGEPEPVCLVVELPGIGDRLGEGTDRGAQFGGASDRVTDPERQPARLTERGGDEYAVVGDVLDPPTGGAQREHIADSGLIDHLLVEFAYASGLLADHEHAEESAVGYGTARGDGEPLGAAPAGDDSGVAVPVHPGAQFGELVGREAARDQVEGRVEDAPAQFTVGRRAPDDLVPVIDLEVVDRGRRDGLLGEDVERILRDLDLLDRAVEHPAHRHRAVQQIGAVLGVEDALADLADLVPGAVDPLQSTRHRRRGLHLDDEIDRTHVDAEFE